jgi:hypothetical protein
MTTSFRTLILALLTMALAGCGKNDSRTEEAEASPPPSASASGGPPPTSLTLASLMSASVPKATVIDAPGMIGSYDSFDPMANIEWAKGVGTNWRPDAVLWTVYTQGSAKDGTVNLATTPDALVAYRFASIRCLKEFRGDPPPRSGGAITAMPTQQSCILHLELNGNRGAPHVTVMTSPLPKGFLDTHPEIETPTCTLAQAIAAAAKAGKVPSSSLFKAGLDHTPLIEGGAPGLANEFWSLSPLDNGFGAQVTAANCAVRK